MPAASRLASTSITAAGRKSAQVNSSARVQTQADRLAGGLGQPGGLDGAFARVLAAEPAAEVGDDDADAVVGQAERPGQLAAHAERVLRGRPDGEPCRRPTRRPPRAAPSGSAGRRRRGTSGGATSPPRRPRRRTDSAGTPPRACCRRWSYKLAARRVRRGLPSGGLGDRVDRLARRRYVVGATTPTKSPSRTADDAFEGLRRGQVDRDELGAVRRPAEDLAVEHPRPGDVRRDIDASPSRGRGRSGAGPRCRGPSTASTGVSSTSGGAAAPNAWAASSSEARSA